HEQILEDDFRHEIRRMIARGFYHLYIFGTAGEGHAVDTARFRAATAIFREETREATAYAQVGVIALSTANAIERLRIAWDLGFRTFQITLPSWGVLNDREVLNFFRDVCGAFPDSRFVHYNLIRAGRILNGNDYRRIAGEVPNLVGTKVTGTDSQLAMSVMTQAPELQHFFVQMFPIAARYGECSLLAADAAMYPSAVWQMFEYARLGETEALFKLHRELAGADETILAPARGPTLMDGAWDKLRVRLGGQPRFPLRLLSPYETISEEAYHACARVAEQYKHLLR
ncbi:MAG: dihydrodipicolinate synthase family protein, partial [Terriglobia bacterium]